MAHAPPLQIALACGGPAQGEQLASAHPYAGSSSITQAPAQSFSSGMQEGPPLLDEVVVDEVVDVVLEVVVVEEVVLDEVVLDVVP
jgi:hypothetical protein